MKEDSILVMELRRDQTKINNDKKSSEEKKVDKERIIFYCRDY